MFRKQVWYEDLTPPDGMVGGVPPPATSPGHLSATFCTFLPFQLETTMGSCLGWDLGGLLNGFREESTTFDSFDHFNHF